MIELFFASRKSVKYRITWGLNDLRRRSLSRLKVFKLLFCLHVYFNFMAHEHNYLFLNRTRYCHEIRYFLRDYLNVLTSWQYAWTLLLFFQPCCGFLFNWLLLTYLLSFITPSIVAFIRSYIDERIMSQAIQLWKCPLSSLWFQSWLMHSLWDVLARNLICL